MLCELLTECGHRIQCEVLTEIGQMVHFKVLTEGGTSEQCELPILIGECTVSY